MKLFQKIMIVGENVIQVIGKTKNKRTVWRITAKVYPTAYPRCVLCKVGGNCRSLCIKLEMINGMRDFVRENCGIKKFQGFTITPQKIECIRKVGRM